MIIFYERSPRSVVANALDIVVSEFEIQSRYYVHFRNNAIGKGMNPFFPPKGVQIVPLL